MTPNIPTNTIDIEINYAELMQNQIENLINEAIGEDIPVCNDIPDEEYANEAYNQALADLRSKTPELAKKIMELIKQSNLALLEEVEEIIGKHNARILNEFQNQGNADMPIIAYDERVCLIPAMQIVTKETLSTLSKHKERLSEK